MLFYILGVCFIGNFLKKFGALLSNELPSKSDSDITESLEIHSNVLTFGSNDPNAPLKMVFGKQAIANTVVNPSKLKGHNLSPHTMRNSLPSFLLQIYLNPGLYWLHRPAFCVLLQRICTPTENIVLEMETMKRIFSSEFVTRKRTSIQDSEHILHIMNSINVLENKELGDLLLTSILPFIFCYFNVVEVIKEQVSHLFI